MAVPGTSFLTTACGCVAEGYSDKNHDLTTVRLCFQAFLPDQNGKFCRIVKPVVSNKIYDKSKFTGDLDVNLSVVQCMCKRGCSYCKNGGHLFDQWNVRVRDQRMFVSVSWSSV